MCVLPSASDSEAPCTSPFHATRSRDLIGFWPVANLGDIAASIYRNVWTASDHNGSPAPLLVVSVSAEPKAWLYNAIADSIPKALATFNEHSKSAPRAPVVHLSDSEESKGSYHDECPRKRPWKWYQLTQDSWILQTASGFHLDFTEDPIQVSLPTLLKMSQIDDMALQAELDDLVNKGAIERALTQRGFCENPSLHLEELPTFLHRLHG
ncbi:Hypothetical predicted protein [Pelobates cultripes]|uniref:Uncharacterized protein n=1 Tax=Pelobates cultripes TaxID=61616 RepID=A0AAD1SAE9_PELCU|nr:Hypothetical predicted protein [Pelobates cultripes]